MAEAPEDRVELAVGGTVFSGWKEIEVSVDLDAGASAFTLQTTERWPGQPDRWVIEAGAAARLSIGGEIVITGYVDKLESNLAGEQHTISVSGRSRAADLVDCSAVATPGNWKNRTLEQIAAELAQPFGIAVTARALTAPAFKRFAIQPGESVWEAIQRMAAHRALLIVSTREGDVEIVSPEPVGPAASIVQGVHPLSIGGSHDVTERYSEYIVKGQSAGDDQVNGRAAARASAKARDPAVRRYRPLVVIAEEQADIAALRRRAQWEATVRAAKAQSATITLPGWRRRDGLLWWPQQKVDLEASSAWIDADMMVAGVRFALGEGGRSVELRLVRPEAYSRIPVPEHAEASRIRGANRRRRRRGDRDERSDRPSTPERRRDRGDLQ